MKTIRVFYCRILKIGPQTISILKSPECFQLSFNGTPEKCYVVLLILMYMIGRVS